MMMMMMMMMMIKYTCVLPLKGMDQGKQNMRWGKAQ